MEKLELNLLKVMFSVLITKLYMLNSMETMMN